MTRARTPVWAARQYRLDDLLGGAVGQPAEHQIEALAGKIDLVDPAERRQAEAGQMGKYRLDRPPRSPVGSVIVEPTYPFDSSRSMVG